MLLKHTASASGCRGTCVFARVLIAVEMVADVFVSN